jgi:hypothetical protein
MLQTSYFALLWITRAITIDFPTNCEIWGYFIRFSYSSKTLSFVLFFSNLLLRLSKSSIIGNLPDGLFAQYLEFKSKSKALFFAGPQKVVLYSITARFSLRPSHFAIWLSFSNICYMTSRKLRLPQCIWKEKIQWQCYPWASETGCVTFSPLSFWTRYRSYMQIISHDTLR